MASETLSSLDGFDERASVNVEVPAPTPWPIVLAFGLALLFAGLVTSFSVSILGAVLAVGASIGWFREVLPHERHASLVMFETATLLFTNRPVVAQVRWMTQELRRARLPLEVYPVSAGIKGGIAGGAAMALLALAYGFFSGHGIWYPINLLAAGWFPAQATINQISAFHADMLTIAIIVHLTCSLLVGLLFSATLPMFPRRPILLGGVIAPILWSGLLHSVLEALDPVLNQRIDWRWFVVSQIGFGLVAGLVVSRQARVKTWQYLPLAVRAGIEPSGQLSEEGPGQ